MKKNMKIWTQRKAPKDKDQTKSVNVGRNPYAQTYGQDENDLSFH